MPMLETRGARVSYSRSGCGPAVLLLRGLGGRAAAWRPQIDGLRDRFTVIAIDNRGIEASALTDGSISIEEMADDALAVMRAERIERFHVVGHSMGGLIALEVALRARCRIESLALLCSFPSGRRVVRASPHAVAAGIRNPLARSRPSILMQQIAAMRRYDAEHRLADLATIHTLVVSATRDRLAPTEVGQSLAQAIPGARYVEVRHSGHGLPGQHPRLVNALLAKHLNRAAKRSRAA